jgi:superfamily I DNA/RNA helicase
LSWLRFHNCILIGELVPETLRYLRDNPNSPHLEAYDHVLVDEYQDLNRAEQELLDHLSNSGNLAIIGDEDQSIYSFKHAHPEGVSGFHQTHLDTHDEDLIDCRRCPTRIVDMANSLISNNQNRTDRILNHFDGNPEGEIYVYSGITSMKRHLVLLNLLVKVYKIYKSIQGKFLFYRQEGILVTQLEMR